MLREICNIKLLQGSKANKAIEFIKLVDFPLNLLFKERLAKIIYFI